MANGYKGSVGINTRCFKLVPYGRLHQHKCKGITQVTYRDAKRFVAANCPHIKIRNNAEIGELRVAYKGLKPDREESMAYYTEDIEDAIGTAATMERDYMLCVHNCDKLPKTLQLERRLDELK